MESHHLNMPFILPSQAQKHVTHNEALLVLDALVQLAILDRDLGAPPASPTEGDRYVVAVSPVGAWAGKVGQIAHWQDGGWRFTVANPGFVAWVIDESAHIYWTGSQWRTANSAIAELQNLSRLGVGTTADTTNPFAAKLNKALWTARTAAEGGDGDLRYTLNKETPADTVSLLLQAGFSGRAELGLIGDNDLRLKTSADAVTWNDALVADRVSGAVRFPSGVVHPDSRAPLAQILPAPVVSQVWRCDPSRAGTPRAFAVSAVAGDVLTFTAAVVDQMFDISLRDVAAVRVWNTSKVPAQAAWVIYNVSTTQIRVSRAADIATWVNGETVRVGDPNPIGLNTLQMIAIDISRYMQANFGTVFRQKGLMLATYCSATGGSATMDVSGSGTVGSAFGTMSLSSGVANAGSHTVFTPVLSPISNSNLLFVRESLGTGTALGICFARVVGLYV